MKKNSAKSITKSEAAARAAIKDMIDKATGAKPKRTKRGPEPERFKITGYRNWEDAVKVALQKPKPPEGWPK